MNRNQANVLERVHHLHHRKKLAQSMIDINSIVVWSFFCTVQLFLLTKIEKNKDSFSRKNHIEKI